MEKSLRESVTEFLRNRRSWDWATPKEVMDALYPKFEKAYPSEDSFRRQIRRILKSSPEIWRNFHSPHYAYKRSRKRFSEDEVEWIQQFFDRVEHPGMYYDMKLREAGIAQYPDLPLEKTALFNRLYMILSKLWRDPRDTEIIDASEPLPR